MNACEWIVCEQSNRWARALRLAVARESAAAKHAMHEVRSLPELASRLQARPQSLAIIEVDLDRVASVLIWLAAAQRRFPQARFVAALDICGLQNRDSMSRSSDGQRPDVGQHHDIVAALLEAGVAEITDSPRRLHPLLALGRRHAALSGARSRLSHQSELSVTAAAWASLPWQDA